jgi:hypothetical protein
VEYLVVIFKRVIKIQRQPQGQMHHQDETEQDFNFYGKRITIVTAEIGGQGYQSNRQNNADAKYHFTPKKLDNSGENHDNFQSDCQVNFPGRNGFFRLIPDVHSQTAS